MPQIKTQNLTGLALEWAVAKCQGGKSLRFDTVATWWIKIDGKDRALSKGWAQSFTPSTDHAHGGPIMDAEGITSIRCDDDYGVDRKGFTTSKRIPVWAATTGQQGTHSSYEGECYPAQYEISASDVMYGPTMLTAAMRALVASKLGAMVEVLQGLLA